MIPSVSCAFGGRLYYCTGSRIVPINNTFINDSTLTQPFGSTNPTAKLPAEDYYNQYLFGGRNTYWAGGYANHKPAAFYYGKLYQALNYMQNDAGLLYITRFDGSGIFINQGDSGYEAAEWKNGRGTEIISSSGTSNEFRTQDMAHVIHNGNLFIFGATYKSSHSAGSNWITKEGWILGTNDNVSSTDRKDRSYKAFIISIDPRTNKEKRFVTPIKSFTGDAPNNEVTHACDAISFGDDIYYANWVDILRLPGGSGVPEVIENSNSIPSAKSFCVYPEYGYFLGEPSGSTKVFCLTGSGVLKTLSPSGTSVIFDLSTINDNVRTGNPWTRVTSPVDEAGRSALLINFNNNLHAFVAASVSGYSHFKLTGRPGLSIDWSNMTNSLPTDIFSFDGNIFGYVDDISNKMYIMHVSMSEVGLYGHIGSQQGAGGITIYEYNTIGEWRNITRGVPGDVSRGLIPYQYLGPFVTIPSGNTPTVYSANDYAIIEYRIHDHYSRNVNISIQYSVDRGASWHDARQFRDYVDASPLGSGIENLFTSPDGIAYEFYWDYVNDVAFGTAEDCLIRILPRLVR